MLNNHIIIGAIITCGLLTISGAFSGSEEKAGPPRLERDSAVAPPAPPLKITVAPAQTEVTIGDWITIILTFTNTTANKMDIIKPMLDIDSVSFYIKTTPLSNTGKSFVYSVITPSAYEHNRARMARISLAAGAQVQETFKMPAVALGLWEITTYYQGFQRPISVEPLKITIIPPKSDKSDNPEKPKDGELIAKIETSKGTMKCRFFFNDAPNTVMSFLRQSKDEFYNRLKFHRIAKGFVIQGGCPQNTGSGDPGYSIKAEFNKNKHFKGTLSMARHSNNNDSASSHFFICLADAPNLDNKYTAFGELISGMDVLEAIGNIRAVANPNMNGEMSKPVENVFVKTITLEFKEAPSKK